VDCKQFEAASALRQKFISNYQIPAELFPKQ